MSKRTRQKNSNKPIRLPKSSVEVTDLFDSSGYQPSDEPRLIARKERKPKPPRQERKGPDIVNAMDDVDIIVPKSKSAINVPTGINMPVDEESQHVIIEPSVIKAPPQPPMVGPDPVDISALFDDDFDEDQPNSDDIDDENKEVSESGDIEYASADEDGENNGDLGGVEYEEDDDDDDFPGGSEESDYAINNEPDHVINNEPDHGYDHVVTTREDKIISHEEQKREVLDDDGVGYDPIETYQPEIYYKPGSEVPMFTLPRQLRPLLELEDCSNFNIRRYLLTDDQKKIFEDVTQMQKVAKRMRDYNVPYLNSTLLYGVPGTGKTTFARWVAYTLKLPMAYINFAKLIDGVFGNTARNITEIFRFLGRMNCIFLVDEIDCVAVKRGTESQATGGELSRITITIMQELDRYRRDGAECILMAASNRLDQIDAALVNRFTIAHEVKPLNNKDKQAYVQKFLDDVGMEYDVENIRSYCIRNLQTHQRDTEADIARCIATYVKRTEIDGEKNVKFYLDHID